MADPEFPVVGRAQTHWGRRRPPMRTIFGRNICQGQASDQTRNAISALPVCMHSHNGGIWQ